MSSSLARVDGLLESMVRIDVEVVGSDGAWLDGDGSLTVIERDGDRVKLLVSDQVDLDALLGRARAAGEVRTFAYQPPRLSELFMEAVTPIPAGDDAMRVAEVGS